MYGSTLDQNLGVDSTHWPGYQVSWRSQSLGTVPYEEYQDLLPVTSNDIGGSAGWGTWECYAVDTWTGTPGHVPCYEDDPDCSPDKTSEVATGARHLLGLTAICAIVGWVS